MSEERESSEREQALREQVAALEARIVELEIAASYDRKTREELDEVVRDFSERVVSLERRVGELLGRLEQFSLDDRPELPE